MEQPFTGYKVKAYNLDGEPVITARYATDQAELAYIQAESMFNAGSVNVEGIGWQTFSCVSVFHCESDRCIDVADYEA